MRMSTMRRMPAAAAIVLMSSGRAIFSVKRGLRRGGVEPLAAAEEIIGIEQAADEVGVGHRRVAAAAAVAHRPRIGARALRPDREEAGAVDPDDRAAAGGDGGEIERGNVELPARHHALGDFERRALDEGDVAAGAAHVEGDEAAFAVAAEMRARLRAGRRAGEQAVHGLLPGDRGGERHHAAVRLHEKALRRGETHGFEPGREIGDIADQHRREIGVDEGRRHARPFADARQHLAGQRHMRLRKDLADERAGTLLVRGIHVGEQIADRDRRDARVP